MVSVLEDLHSLYFPLISDWNAFLILLRRSLGLNLSFVILDVVSWFGKLRRVSEATVWWLLRLRMDVAF